MYGENGCTNMPWTQWCKKQQKQDMLSREEAEAQSSVMEVRMVIRLS